MLEKFDEYDFEDYQESNLPYGARNDAVAGYIYLFKAPDFHGWLPGVYLNRCKIGLSRNPNARADRIESNQPAHDIEILHTVYVDNMADIEAKLHARFAAKNVHLNKSREWFDMTALDIEWCKFLMNRYAANRRGISYKHALIGLTVVFGLGVVATIPAVNLIQSFSTSAVQLEEVDN